MELPAGHRGQAIWERRSHTLAVVLHLRQHAHTAHHHPYHDYRLASCYHFRIQQLDIIEPGFRARAHALLNARPDEQTCVVVILFENKSGIGLGSGCFLHKVEEFELNQYARASIYSAPQAFRRILLHKARRVKSA